MVTITETKKIIRIENSDRTYTDFDLSSYNADRYAREWFNDMTEQDKHPRMYRGTITMELTEVD